MAKERAFIVGVRGGWEKLIVILALERIHGHVDPLTPERKLAGYLENVYYLNGGDHWRGGGL